MYKNFFYTTELNFKKFSSFLPNKKSIILDYGCGNGVFTNKNLKCRKIKLIKMIDKDKKLKNFIKNKYSTNKKVVWIEGLNSKFDVVFINSVIQYMDLKEYKKLLNFFIKKKINLIIISDIPKYPRILEAFFLIFINPFKLFKGFNYLLSKNYIKTGFYFKRLNQLVVKNNAYLFKKENNLNEDQFMRYSLIIKKIK